MGSLFDLGINKLLRIAGVLAEKMPPDIGDAICDDPEIVQVMIDAARQFLNRNRREMSVEAQIAALRAANDEGSWGLTEEVFTRLAATAPAWPEGRNRYRSFRIRFGSGGEGVAQTFDRHVGRIRSVFGEKAFRRSDSLGTTMTVLVPGWQERIRLLNGDRDHVPVIEWVIVDCGTRLEWETAAEVSRPAPLADELLVMAWLFPEMIRTKVRRRYSVFIAAGYQVTLAVSSHQRLWDRVVKVGYDATLRRVFVDVEFSDTRRLNDRVPWVVSKRSVP